MSPSPRLTRSARTTVPAPAPFSLDAIRPRGLYWPAIVRLYGSSHAADLSVKDAYALGAALIAAAAIAEGRLDAADVASILHAADSSIGAQARAAHCAQLRAAMTQASDPSTACA